MRYTHYRGLAQVSSWVRLKFAAMNLKKLARWKTRKRFALSSSTATSYILSLLAVLEPFPLTASSAYTSRTAYRYANISDLTASPRDYITFYNEKRPHSSIGNLTPVQAEDNYYKEQSTAKSIGCAPFAYKK